VFIEADDFQENPPPKYFRCARRRSAAQVPCIIKCDEVVKDAAGQLVEPAARRLASRTGGPNAGRKIKGTIHWVSAVQAIDAEVRLYDRLFTVPEPGAGRRLQESSTRTRSNRDSKLEPPSGRPG